MTSAEIMQILVVWTPFLAGGFAWIILISLVSMTIGTVLGAVLARLRLSRRKSVAGASLAVTELTRNIPTFVFLFYLAFAGAVGGRGWGCLRQPLRRLATLAES